MAAFPAHTDPKATVPELALYLKGELPPLVRTAFEAHLPGCDRCRKAVAVAQSMFPTVPHPAPAPEAEAPKSAAELVALMEAQLERTRARNQKLQDRRSRNAIYALAVIAVIACIGAYGMIMLRRGPAIEALTNPGGKAQMAP